MSSALFRQPVLKRVPLVRYSALTKRENKIQVQLLRDFPEYGVKGEIITVLPGLMRNKLHPKNGAAYINPRIGLGPKIPVVKRDLRQQQLQQQQQLLAQQRLAEQQAAAKKAAEETVKASKKQAQKVEPVDLDDLLSGISARAGASTIESTSGYSMITLNVGLEALRFSLSEVKSVTKASIASYIFSHLGVEVPESDIQFKSKNGDILEKIDAEGTYALTITQEGYKSAVKKTVVVSA